MKRIILFFVLGATFTAFAAEPRPPERYCNPLPIPDYPMGKLMHNITKGEPNDGGLWLAERKEQYRELAVPTTASRARLVILGHPEGIQPAVAEFTVFGLVQ